MMTTHADSLSTTLAKVCQELRRTLVVVLVCLAFSFSISYYNSWLLQDSAHHPGFIFPMLYTLTQMVFQALAISCVFLLLPKRVVGEPPTIVGRVRGWCR